MRLELKPLAAIALLALAACARTPPPVRGTLEYDRISLPAPAAEHIVAIDVREGQRVRAGQRLLQLETTRTAGSLAAAQAQGEQARQALAELQAGPRAEQIAQARAQLAALQAQARDAAAYYQRMLPLGRQRMVAASDVDRARAAAGNADGQVAAARQALLELEHGNRTEDIAQGRAALAASQAQAQVQQVTLDKLDLRAPREGVVDALPYRLGDQAPVGAPLAVLLVGQAPYARVYVPETRRAGVQVGDAASVTVTVDGQPRRFDGHVRMIRREPVFTPYYALVGQDAEQLSYLAEVQLDAAAAALPAGLPVQVALTPHADGQR